MGVLLSILVVFLVLFVVGLLIEALFKPGPDFVRIMRIILAVIGLIYALALLGGMGRPVIVLGTMGLPLP